MQFVKILRISLCFPCSLTREHFIVAGCMESLFVTGVLTCSVMLILGFKRCSPCTIKWYRKSIGHPKRRKKLEMREIVECNATFIKQSFS